MVGAGQKSGVNWALDPDTGATIWATLAGPGGATGGIEWGSATDGAKIYVAITNSSNISYTLAPAHTVPVNAGSWAALDPETGNIIWQIPATGQNPKNPKLGAGAAGQMSASALADDRVTVLLLLAISDLLVQKSAQTQAMFAR
jgi:polyvinyl alcohol dehydrogenase (cytochrome)